MDTQTNTPAAQPAASNPVSAFAFPKAGKIFGQAQEIYKTKFRELILITLCQIGVTMAAGFIFGAGATYLKSASGSEKIAGVVFLLLILLFLIYVSVWTFAATIRNISSLDANASAGKSFSESSHDIMPLILTGLLTLLFILGGYILLIIPGIILSFWYSQSAYVIITEGLSGKKALDQSKRYVTGNIWEIFKKGFFIGIITFLVAMGVGFLFGITATLLDLTFLPTIANIIFQTFWTPLVSIYAFLIFQYLRQSKTVSTPAQ